MDSENEPFDRSDPLNVWAMMYGGTQAIQSLIANWKAHVDAGEIATQTAVVVFHGGVSKSFTAEEYATFAKATADFLAEYVSAKLDEMLTGERAELLKQLREGPMIRRDGE